MRALRALCATLGGAAALAVSTVCPAEQWPSRSILVVSPFGGGTTMELVADIVLDHAGRALGQRFVFERQPGGGGTTGVVSVVRAEPDGYTLLLSSSLMNTAAILRKSLPYDASRDLAPVAMLGGQPSVLLAAPQDGFKTVADLVAAAKAKPGQLKFASVGLGSASYFAAERFRLAAGVDVQHVAYGRGFDALHDLMAGRVDFYFVPVPPALPLMKQGKVAALAVSTPTRVSGLPDVPTLGEGGYTVAPYLFWCGLSAPAKTPRAVVDRLNSTINNALAIPGVQQRLLEIGLLPSPMSADQFGRFFAADLAATIKFGKDAHIEPTD